MASEYQSDAMQYRSKPAQITVSVASDDLYGEDDCIPNSFKPRPFTSTNSFSDTLSGDITVTPDKRLAEKQFGATVRRTVSFKDGADGNMQPQFREYRSDDPVCKTNPRDQAGTRPKRTTKAGKSLYRETKSRSTDRNNSLESIESTEMTQSSEDSLETIDVLASDLSPTRHLSRVLPEHPLARPEFSSILQLKQHQHVVEKSSIDVISAVTEKLSIDKNRTKLDEAALKRLNRGGTQFQKLQSTDVSEDQMSRTRQIKTARIPSYVPKAQRVKNRPEPDILQCFKRELQKETASFSVDISAKLLQPSLQTADASQVFDVYQHIRSWEGL